MRGNKGVEPAVGNRVVNRKTTGQGQPRNLLLCGRWTLKLTQAGEAGRGGDLLERVGMGLSLDSNGVRKGSYSDTEILRANSCRHGCVAGRWTVKPVLLRDHLSLSPEPSSSTWPIPFAVKPDAADSNAATEPGKCKRLLYHFEGLLDSATTSPGDDWESVTVDNVLKVAKLKSPNMEAAIRAAGLPCYYRAGTA